MKGLLLTACALLLFGAANAQDNKGDNRNDDDMSVSSPSALDGSPRPDHGQMHVMHHPECAWNDVQTIALAPFQFSENGVGVGLSYERALDPDGIISVYVPAIATWNLARYNDYYGGTYGGHTNSMFYLMPGIKFYPTGMGRVKYAVGPSVVVGAGQKVMDNIYDPIYGYPSTTLQNRMIFGMMLNNSLNVSATPHLYIGAELGMGFTYIDRINNVNHGSTFLIQGSFKIGYTF
jgi:hypothetical protein